MKKIFLLVFIAISIVGCKTKKYSYQENPGDKIIFGEGGGFAGSYDQYSLFENGQLFYQMGFDTASNTEVSFVKGKQVKSLFERFTTIGFKNIDYDNPGNLYRFIEIDERGKKHKVQWAAGDETEMLKEVVNLYYELQKLTSKNE